jgi:Domain of unknown function (DUF4082)/Bacterial Ig-like domain/Bacterial Ig domain/Secretion system C-terminal sorting domain
MYQKTLPYVRGIKYAFILFLALFFFQSSFSQNAIVTENLLPGTPATTWDIPAKDAGDLSIQGFATDISVNAGNPINFKIDVNTGTDKTFNISIYRIGYYQGNGARLIIDLGPGFTFTGIAQGACNFDGVTGLTDCGNWTTTASWNVPSTAVSGLYIAKLTRSAAGGGGTSHIPFVVRNDANVTSPLFFKTSDATWQAYNNYGGNSLYVGAGLPNNHASKVSFNRPFMTRSGGGGGAANEDWFMNAEYPMIRFLESNGFDMVYTTDVDVARNNANNVNLLLNHKIFISTGHDEYWSKEERNSVEAAKAAGKNLAFFSGNEVYWKTRWENSIDGTSTPFRTMVCYKEGTLPTPAENACGGKCDVSTLEWTGLWRDGCNYTGVVDACKPENALTGQISWDGIAGTILVPDTYKNLRFWRNTTVATLGAGATATLTNGTLGYEWDWYQYASTYPPGRVTMSSTTLDGRIHNLSLYKDVTSKALVFGAGTVQWAWGLDANHDVNTLSNGGPADQNMQQATINLLADMGAQPGSIKSPLTAATQSTDVTPPVSTITSPANGANIPQSAAFNITGTATDVGGVVAGVEVSVDGGLTWQAAIGTTSWSFSWLPSAQGTVTIKSRAFDDIGNLESPGGSEGSANTVTVTVIGGAPPTNCPCSIYTQPVQSPTNNNDLNQNDNIPPGITVGVKFKADFDGTISGIRFFKAPLDNATTDEHVTLYALSPDGGVTAGATIAQASLPSNFSHDPVNGEWAEVSFTSPIAITANTVYVATYFSPTGFYNATSNSFTNPVVNGPLAILKDGDQGVNGAYDYDDVYPTQGFEASNYWVDVDYSTGADITPPTVIFNTPATSATNININSSVSVTFSENIDPLTVTASTFVLKDGSGNVIPGTVSYSAGTRTATILLSSALDYSTIYFATVTTGIKDLSGNAMASNYNWSFTTAPVPAIPPDDGSGGPILIISSNLNPFSRYLVEILRAQGYTAFKAVDISEVEATPAMLNSYDVILLGQMNLNSTDVSLLTAWTTAGGTLIAQRPSSLLYPLMGITSSGSIVDNFTNTYLLVNTTTGLPGAGIVNQTIQFHGVADLYSMQTGTTSLATLYSSATTATPNAAITSVNVGTNGGKAIAFAFDLAKSIVLTRQGNTAWAGSSRDGQTGPTRSDNLFFPNYVDFNKIQIPQADEQQHLLTNIILLDNLHNKPLPHLWILPSGLKAAVVMTGDDHNNGSYPGSSGTAGRFNEYRDMSPDNSPTAVDDWKAIRGTSYVFNGISMDDDSVAYYQSLGFEIALHPNTNCVNFTPSSLTSTISTQLSQLEAQLPSMNQPVTNRTHCMPWSDWASQPKIENSFGIRFDVNYYYWPATWVQNRPGLFTGSGMPMRFADVDGTLIDCFQAPTQMPDESGLDITNSINTLLDNAINKGYYGAFVMNMHTDTAIHVGSDEIIASATARNIPVVSAKQMLTWLDSRNGTKFSNMAWDNVAKKLSFDLTTTAHNLQAMVPFNSADGTLIQVTQNGVPLTFTTQTVKGISYGFFPASSQSYVAIYSSTPLPVTLLNFTVTKQGDNAQLNWSTSSEENNKGFEIQRSTDQSTWTVLNFIAGAGNSQTEKDYQYLDQNLPAGTYYYRLRQVDYDGNSSFSKIVPVTFDGGLALELKQNRPNPFNNYTSISMVIPKAGRVQLMLYDQMGRPIQQLMDEEKMPGTYSVTVNRNGLSSGIYYYKMNALGQVIVKKMTIL